MAADVDAAGYPTLYNSYTQRGFELDHMSIYDYIERYVPGGHRSPLGALLDVAYNIEYGAETRVQSSLNMLYLIGFSQPNTFTIFGESDEKFHIRGGNDQVPTILAARLAGHITTDTPLVAIKRRDDGTFKLTFRNGAGSFDGHDRRRARAAVLDPPLVCRLLTGRFQRREDDRRSTSRGWARTRSSTCSSIRVSGGTQGCNGETYSDRGYQNTWEVTRAQGGTSGILSWYTGGNIGVAVGSGTPQQQAKTFLKQIEPVLPGATEQWNGRVTRDYWTGYQWTQGLVLLLEGRAVHALRRRRGATAWATATSAASTPRSISRGT